MRWRWKQRLMVAYECASTAGLMDLLAETLVYGCRSHARRCPRTLLGKGDTVYQVCFH